MKESYDVVIVGGGIVGSAIAYFLGAEATFQGSVLVVERDPAYEFCSTTRSWGGIRFQFTTPECIAMSLYGAAFVREAGARLGTAGDKVEIPFAEHGYLLLLDEDAIERTRAEHALQEAHGGSPLLLDRDELAARFPALDLEGVAGASFGQRDEGWIDPSLLLNAFKAKARELGVEYVADEVTGLECTGDRVTGVGSPRAPPWPAAGRSTPLACTRPGWPRWRAASCPWGRTRSRPTSSSAATRAPGRMRP
jgi:sarcosine oxidase